MKHKNTTPLPEAQPLKGVKTAEAELTIIELAESAEQMAERYASWFGIYNNPEWDKLRLAYLAGERFGRLKIQGQVISTNELRDLADKHCYLTDFDKYKDSPLDMARYTYERSFRDSEAYHAQFATDAGGGKQQLLTDCQEMLMNLIALNHVPDEVCPDMNDMISRIDDALIAPSTHSSSERVEKKAFAFTYEQLLTLPWYWGEENGEKFTHNYKPGYDNIDGNPQYFGTSKKGMRIISVNADYVGHTYVEILCDGGTRKGFNGCVRSFEELQLINSLVI